MHFCNPSIFRAYDIRGIFGKDLLIQDAYYIGRAFGSLLLSYSKTPLIYLGYDVRLSSKPLADSLINGLERAGIKIINLGIAPTALITYMHIIDPSSTASICITGSHNPPEYNGFKINLDRKPFFGSSLTALCGIIEAGLYSSEQSYEIEQGQKTLKLELFEKYYDHIKKIIQEIKPIKNLKIVWDLGGGAACEVTKKIINFLPKNCENILINADFDPYFKLHLPDPMIKENLLYLQTKVKEKNADFGIAFDGDADRLIITYGDKVLFGDDIAIIFIKDLIREYEIKDLKIIIDIKSNQTLLNFLEEHKIEYILCKTGHSYIRQMIYDTNATMGCEMSGHLFFNIDNYAIDDAIFAAIKLIKICLNNKESLAEIYDSFPKSFKTGEIVVKILDDNKKFEIIALIKEMLLDEEYEVLMIDGVRVTTEDGWFLIRASNTEPQLTIRCEGNSETSLEILKDICFSYVEKAMNQIIGAIESEYLLKYRNI